MVPEESRLRPTFAEIDLEAFDRNVDAIRAILPEGSRMIAVVKADAYGHGAVPLALRCEDRVGGFAVALLEEAESLADAGIRAPILILGPLTAPQFDLCFERGFLPGVIGPEELAVFAARARALSWKGEIHLKLDSGMGRMGFLPADLEGAAATLEQLPGVRIGGIYTHYANAADPDDPYTARQSERFEAMLGRLRDLGVESPLHHVANSAAIARGLVRPGDWVRAGIILYGAEPLDKRGARLAPLLRWTTRIARLKTVQAGAPIGYGCTWRAPRESRIATLVVGYADGYSRSFSNRAEVLVRGKRAPVVGRVSMDLVTIDVTEVPEAQTGDEVVLLGRQGEMEIPAEELAAHLHTISYEILCGVGRRVPRIWVESGRRTVATS